MVLPEELTNDDLNSIMIGYLNSDHPSPNYVKVLASWPSSASKRFLPSPDTVVLAKRIEKASLEELLAKGVGLQFGTGVVIDEQQEACKGITYDGLNITHVFSGKWLGRFLDNPTILNNFIYVFDFVDSQGILTMPARAHEETALVESLGIHVLNEYRTSNAFYMRNAAALLKTIAYARYLKQHDARLESAIEWVFNRYFEEEFGIKGFSLSLPAEEASWLEKCKSIGPEIERVIKAYGVLAKRGVIDDAFFPFETVKFFKEYPSLNGSKYAIAGKKLEECGFNLFSDQSLLAYIEDKDTKEHCFFDLLMRHAVSRANYLVNLHPIIDQLLDESFIEEDDQTGMLRPTLLSDIMKRVWDTGAITLKHCSNDIKEQIGILVDRGILAYCDALFTPDEAAYLNYVFNDALFSNSLGLRNRYDHANSAITDPNSGAMRDDYYRLLTTLIAITIKINEELQDKTGRGGPSEFVDWPLYDESVFETASQVLVD